MQLAVAGLDEHLLVGLVGEVRVVDRRVGDARLAVAGVLVGERVGADRAAEDERDDDEREPAADGDLAVLRAPISGARSKVSLRHFGLLTWGATCSRRLPSGRRHVIRARRPVGLRRPTDCAVGLAIALLVEQEDQQQDDDDQKQCPYTDVHGTGPTPGRRLLLAAAQLPLTSSRGSASSRAFSPFLARRSRLTTSQVPFGFCAVASTITSLKSSSAVSMPGPQSITSASPSRVLNVSLPSPPCSMSPCVSLRPCTSLRASAHSVSSPASPQRLVLPATRVDRVVARPAVLLVVAGPAAHQVVPVLAPVWSAAEPAPQPVVPEAAEQPVRAPPPQIRSLPSPPVTVSGPLPAPTRSSPASASITSARLDPLDPVVARRPDDVRRLRRPCQADGKRHRDGQHRALCDYI